MRAAAVVAAWALLAGASVSRAQFDGAATQPDGAEAHKAQVKADAADWSQRNATQYGNDADYVVKPNLLIDKKHRVVTIKGYATGISGKEPIEFYLISPSSGKGYEGIAVSLALPSDIHAGLEAIGLPAGRPVNYSKMRFWPKGERVKVTFGWEEKSPDGNVSKRRCRAEEMLIARETGKPLAPTGLVFVGSTWIDGDKPGDPKRYYADLGDPGAIASTYNEATTVLDVPAQARQSSVYQSRVVNPACKLVPGQPLDITFEPDHPAGPRVVDVAVDVDGAEPAEATFSVNAQKGLTGEKMLAAMEKLVADGHEPFVTVTPGDGLSLRAVKGLYGLMEGMEDTKGIRLEPPPSGQLFHEAFSPEEAFRDYKKRTWQPIEVRFAADGKATLIDIVENETGPERLSLKKTDVASPDELTKLLKDRADQRRPIAIFAPAEMRYGELRKWLAGSMTEDAVVWVYLE